MLVLTTGAERGGSRRLAVNWPAHITRARSRTARTVAGMNGNVWGVHDHIRTLIRSRQQIDPATLTDPGTDLESLAGELAG